MAEVAAPLAAGTRAAASNEVFARTGKPLPAIRITTSQSVISPNLFAPVVPGKASLAKKKHEELQKFKDVRKCDRMIKVMRRHTNQLLEDAHFLRECFTLLDEDGDGKLNRAELQRWMAIMSGSEPTGVRHEYKINWDGHDNDMDDLLKSLDISDLESHGGVAFDEFLMVMHDFYTAVGTIQVHNIFKDLIDPEQELQKSLDSARRERSEERLENAGTFPQRNDSDAFAEAEGSPRAAEVPTASSDRTEATPNNEPGAIQAEQQVGVKTRTCTIL